MSIKKHQVKILVALLIIAIAVWGFVFAEGNKNLLKVKFFDVGQGDSILIETPDKKQVLIDGGPDLSVLEKIGRELPFYDHYIDMIILTHPESDHLNGLIEIVKRYQIGAVVMNGIYRNTNEYKELIEIIENKNIPIYIAEIGGEIILSENIKLKILYPFEKPVKQVSDFNNYSIVSKLVYNNFEVLFTGDIEKSTENKLINSGVSLTSDVLKVAHHGSKTSTTEEFLKAVNAQLAIIGVGKDNPYGHPHQEVLERLKNLRVFQTGKDGDIVIFSDGEYLATFPDGSLPP